MITGLLCSGPSRRSVRQRLQDVGAQGSAEFIAEPLFRLTDAGTWEIALGDWELESKDWVSNVVGVCAERQPLAHYIPEGPDAEPQLTRQDAEIEAHLRREDSYSSHLGLQALIMPSPARSACGLRSSIQYARILRSMCEAAPACSYKQYWVTFHTDLTEDGDQWPLWDQLRYLTNHHHKVGILLCITPPSGLSASSGDENDAVAVKLVNRWLAEPIKALWLPNACFLRDEARPSAPPPPYPYCRTALQPLFRLQKLHVLLTAKYDLQSGGLHKDNLLRKKALLAHQLDCQTAAGSGAGSAHVDPYKDTLQEPLQPLADNLDSATYEVFEKDVVKYERYELAIFKALTAKRAHGNAIEYLDAASRARRVLQINTPLTLASTLSAGHSRGSAPAPASLQSPHMAKAVAAAAEQKQEQEEGLGAGAEEEAEITRVRKRGIEDTSSTPETPPQPSASASASASAHTHLKPVVIAVLGAGRGPIVACAIRAAASAGVHVRILCVEKNENALHTLRARCRLESLWAAVELVAADMRTWEPREQEQEQQQADVLVSELLGSWGDNELSPECLDGAMHLLKSDGVCIPQSYTSFLAPVSSAKLWACSRDVLQGKGLDTPFVVNLHACNYLAKPQGLFTFRHAPGVSPGSDNSHNRRFSTLRFRALADGVLHGLAGFFECTLFDSVQLSTHPDTWQQHNKNMYSWFPMFLPFGTPVSVRDGDTIEVSVWRCTDNGTHRVWYEWCLTLPLCLPIQNSQGRSSFIGL